MKKILFISAMIISSSSFASSISKNTFTLKKGDEISVVAFSGYCDGVNIEIKNDFPITRASVLCLSNEEVDALIVGLKDAKDAVAGFQKNEINFSLDTAQK